jgi:thiol-disulfide isomerase/thioredoxin
LFLLLSSYQTNRVSVLSFAELEPHLSFSNDSTYIINFWATWCAPCVTELPYFLEANDVFADKKIKILLVSLDFPKSMDSRLIPFIKKHNIDTEVVLLNEPNANEWIDKVDPSWSGAIPATLVYSGQERQFHEGELSKEELFSMINRSLN